MRARAQREISACHAVLMSVQRPESGPTPDVVETCVDWLIECLARDAEFAESFERTPGKAAHVIGIPFALVPSVLEAYWRRSHGISP